MRRHRRHFQAEEPPKSPVDVLCRRAWKCVRRGKQRQAMLALRQAAHSHEMDARLWTLYGAQCIRSGRIDAARQALNHALWLRERSDEPGKARVTRQLIDSLDA